MKESWTEKAIKLFVYTRRGWGQKVHSGALMVSGRGVWGKPRQYKVHLADKWTPDMLHCVPLEITQDMVGTTVGVFVAVEVKKDAVEVTEWRNLQKRVQAGEKLPMSYDREEAQIVMARKIEKAGGWHFIVHSLQQFIDEVTELFPLLK